MDEKKTKILKRQGQTMSSLAGIKSTLGWERRKVVDRPRKILEMIGLPKELGLFGKKRASQGLSKGQARTELQVSDVPLTATCSRKLEEETLEAETSWELLHRPGEDQN